MEECAEKTIQGWTLRVEGGEGNSRGRGEEKYCQLNYDEMSSIVN